MWLLCITRILLCYILHALLAEVGRKMNLRGYRNIVLYTAMKSTQVAISKSVHTIVLIVASLVVAVIPRLGVLVVALLAVLRITAITPLAALVVVVVLVPRLVIPASILWELLARLERLGPRLERTCARAERGLLGVVVQVHLLGLS